MYEFYIIHFNSNNTIQKEYIKYKIYGCINFNNIYGNNSFSKPYDISNNKIY